MFSREVPIYMRHIGDVLGTPRPRSNHEWQRPAAANDQLAYDPMTGWQEKGNEFNDLITYGTYVTS